MGEHEYPSGEFGLPPLLALSTSPRALFIWLFLAAFHSDPFIRSLHVTVVAIHAAFYPIQKSDMATAFRTFFLGGR
jgi:hypothetical protein